MSREETGFREGTPEEIQRRKDAVCQAALEFERWLHEEFYNVPQKFIDGALDLLIALSALYRDVDVDIDAECMDS
jgi:hypothetical protein